MGYLTEALLRGLIQESRDWDWCQYALGERGRPFSWSGPDKHMQFVVRLPVRVSQSLSAVPSSQQAGSQDKFCSCFGPTSVNAQRGLGHSPLAASNTSLCGLNSHDSGSSGQCLFLHRADG